MMMIRRFVFSALLSALMWAPPVLAQEAYPSRPVTFMVGFAAGGGNDVLARILAEHLQQALGQTFIVENRPGASGMVAISAVRRATPDGYTLLVGSSSAMTVNPLLLKSANYNPVEDFVPVAMIGHFPLIVAVNPSVPAKTLQDFIRLAKAEPGKINYSSAASSFQIATEMFAQRAGIKLQNVPYRGSAPAVMAVVANDVSLTLGDISTVLPQIQGGTLRGLAVTTLQRIPSLPDIPTAGEAGLPGFEVVPWSALFAPAGTPAAVVGKLERETARILALPEVQAKVRLLGIEPSTTSAAQVPERIRTELELFRKVAETAGIKPE
ncbi:tripartite tricarboxylate transporter substrate binding protein [Methylocella sp. CPCC 101449]|jgi:tripartite-type tricarboxylate transporter receptor subunit TctC|uniref:Bug family tripartite tricarboxylate transporter substrate binding protein n=1 Tax=Methylocella sp. CPCC 101449 TaxID=2987531 RepID=UPI002890FBF3|nr:tripartite tricarboxylate transporter substrate binding protein [Methylocella sp. CPCC 101449]MDT2020073.1 tripartite tricarboxylate transporter substrate binding protein [Methylocella sp. CPCC 101449]HEV2574988.1 tripartite tricarboxylate transporter substrate binding protein [Beijerinckiaceae bacterium]